MTLKGISMPAVAAAGAGALVIWSGLKGASVSGGVRSLISGQQPTGANVNGIAAAALPAGGAPAGATGSVIADDALRYRGNWTYVWGGAPGGGNSGDCSSFANAVIGRDLGDPVPGFRAGTYHGQVHGAPTMVWAVWNGCRTIPRAQCQAGDLAIWPATHMGIAISGTQMISALNPAMGAQVTNIFPGAMIRRLK